ncbi:hypothetical protein RRG08_025189 [Elysia crispata]|uniref:Uncharacterized protein n=1 Tax=Elysia crispata TaxID=231223 RepID=A0AAE0ZB38_9GAST|nr:hypothetical protein RRG08_025189 [Elysia crispata]
MALILTTPLPPDLPPPTLIVDVLSSHTSLFTTVIRPVSQARQSPPANGSEISKMKSFHRYERVVGQKLLPT